jgi:hypothetical protein
MGSAASVNKQKKQIPKANKIINLFSSSAAAKCLILVEKFADFADLFSNNEEILKAFESYIEKQEWLSNSFIKDSVFSDRAQILSVQSVKIIEEFGFVYSDYAFANYDIRIDNCGSICFPNKDMKIFTIAMLVHPFIKSHLNHSEDRNVKVVSEYFKLCSRYEISPEQDESNDEVQPFYVSSTRTGNSPEKNRVMNKTEVALKENLVGAVKDMKKGEISEVLYSKSWVEQFVEAVDDCCFCITVASARQQGFPLLYVNKAFQRITGK